MSDPDFPSRPPQTTHSPISLLDHHGRQIPAQPGHQSQNTLATTPTREEFARNSGTCSGPFQGRFHESRRDHGHYARQQEVGARQHEARPAVPAFGFTSGTRQQPYHPFGMLTHQPYRPSPLAHSSTSTWVAPIQRSAPGTKAFSDRYLGSFVLSNNPEVPTDHNGWLREPQRAQQVPSNVEAVHQQNPHYSKSSSIPSLLTAETAFTMPRALPGVELPSAHQSVVTSGTAPAEVIEHTVLCEIGQPNTQNSSTPSPVQPQASEVEIPSLPPVPSSDLAPQRTTEEFQHPQEPQRPQEPQGQTISAPGVPAIAKPKRGRGRPRKYQRVGLTQDPIMADTPDKMKGKAKENRPPSTSDQLPMRTPSGITIAPNHSTPLNPKPKTPSKRGPRGPYKKKVNTDLGSLVAPAPQPKKKKGTAAANVLPTPAASPSPTKDTNDSPNRVMARLYSPPHPEPQLQAYRRQLATQRANDMITNSDLPDETINAMLPQFRKAGYIPDWERFGYKTKLITNPMTGEEETKVVVQRFRKPKKLDVALENKLWLQEIAMEGSLEMGEKCLELINDIDKGWVPVMVVWGYGRKKAEEFDWSCWDEILEQVPTKVKAWKTRQDSRVKQREKEIGWIVKYGVNQSVAEDTGGWVEDWEGGEEATEHSHDGKLRKVVQLGYRGNKGRQRDRSEEGWMEVPEWKKMCMRKGFRFKDKYGGFETEEDLDVQIAALDAGIADLTVLEAEAMEGEAAEVDEGEFTDGLESDDDDEGEETQ